MIRRIKWLLRARRLRAILRVSGAVPHVSAVEGNVETGRLHLEHVAKVLVARRLRTINADWGAR